MWPHCMKADTTRATSILYLRPISPVYSHRHTIRSDVPCVRRFSHRRGPAARRTSTASGRRPYRRPGGHTTAEIFPYEDIDFAKVDHHRAIRQGFPEVVFGEGKTPDQIAAIASTILTRSDRLLVTRATADAFDATREQVDDARYDEVARCIVVDRRIDVARAARRRRPVRREPPTSPSRPRLPITAELIGCQVERISDVGVSGSAPAARPPAQAAGTVAPWWSSPVWKGRCRQ